MSATSKAGMISSPPSGERAKPLRWSRLWFQLAAAFRVGSRRQMPHHMLQ
jgi:hypothetical protein